ncbi:FeoA family protein [Actinomyces ruminicola]|uniref:Fe2+ transport system protein FeoA n=1 Tax=Actinomyces ruminicola TaxID=332524 RepID=A0A1H0AV58_9ACTO|nr:FeoA family protein [Actinomyces ruminicola]SDM30311.1 FeoA domain-containing protein [Actinomyces ruminicola]SDN37264.1 Fe2+ transport system protein FeoA [Actinomyces ruminicola]
MAAPATASTIPSEHAASTVPLSTLCRGTRARITAVSASRGEQLARRLADLGFEPGRRLEVGRRAPLGDPTVYHVADYEISLRRRDAALVSVEVIAPTTPGATAEEAAA